MTTKTTTLGGALTDAEMEALLRDIDKVKLSAYQRSPMVERNLTVEECRRKFGVRDSVLMNFVPMMLSSLAREEAEKLVNYGRDYRIEEIKKHSRLIKTALHEYERLLTHAYGRAYDAYIDYRNRYRDEINSNIWLMEMEADTLCANQIRDCPYRMVAGYALIVMMLLDYVEEYDRKVDKLIRERLGAPISRKPDMFMKMLGDLCADILKKHFPVTPNDTMRTWVGVLSNQAHFLVERIMDEEDKKYNQVNQL